MTLEKRRFRRRTLWDANGIHNLVLIASSMASASFLKLIAQYATRSIGIDMGFDTIYVGTVEEPNVFVPKWRASKEGLERIGHTSASESL
jgi:hypothetical protein